jgi:hypothetical protein
VNSSSQTLVVALHDRSEFQKAQETRRLIESAYETTVAVQELPSAHVAWEATESSVLVTATDMNVLAEWLFVMHGSVSKVDLPSGQTVWTLRTKTWTDSPAFPVVPVFVSVVQASSAPVMHEIAEAVSAA